MRQKIHIFIFGVILVLFGFGVLAGDLPAPQKIFPPDGEAVGSEKIAFSWQSVTGADKYQVAIWLGPDKPLVGDEADKFAKTSGTSETFNLNPQTTYWWNVRACHGGLWPWSNDCDSQDFGPFWMFTTGGVLPLKIITTRLPEGTVGLEYGEKIDVEGGVLPLKYTGYFLPNDLTLDPDSGVVGGIPREAAADFVFAVRVEDNREWKKKDLIITIKSVPLEIITTSADLPQGYVNTPYPDTKLQAQGGDYPYVWSEDGLPNNGIRLTNDIISGTPQKEGTIDFTASVTDKGGEGLTVGKPLSIKINPEAESPTPPSGTTGGTTGETTGGGDTSGGQPSGGQGLSITIPNPLGENTTLEILLNKIIDFIFWVGITVAPIILIIAGFMFVIFANEAQKIETAKKMIWYALIGLVVLLLARGLVEVLKSVIGVK